MAVYDQIVTSYSDTTPQVRVISDVIDLIDPRDTPLVVALGGLDGARSKFRIRESGTKIELLEDALDPLSVTLTGATQLTDATGTTETVFSVPDASIFQDGHVIQIDNEYMVIKSADTSANTVSVYSRSYGGTNDTHGATASLTIVGMARLEGDDADYGPIVDIWAPYNYTDIFQKAIKVSGTQQVVSQYGISDEFAYQANKAVPALMRLVEKAAFHGIRAAGSASAPRSMGGLGTFIGSNTVAAGGAIAKSDVDNLAEAIFGDGGNPDLLVVNHAVANDLRNLIDSSSFVRVNQENSVFGMMPIERMRTQYGELQLVASRWCPVATAYMLDSSRAGFFTLRPFQMKQLSVTGDSVKGEVVGEFSLLVHQNQAHGTITGLTS